MTFLSRVLLALGGLLVFSGPLQAGDAIPRPPGLEPEVAFWRRIFAECSSEQGLIHDNRHLGIVYEKIDMSGNPARLQRTAEAARQKYERILRTLGSGKRSGLTTDEARVLALWPAGVSNAQLRAAVEQVRFQQGLAERFHAGLVRSGQWWDYIIKLLREEGLPEELAAMPHVESSFDPNARSFVGAAGMWQFTGSTGRRYLRIDQAVDERRDPYESSRAATQLLKYNYSVLGTWPLAITAYNHGTAGMNRAAKTMGTTDIETIIRRYDGPAFKFASRNFYVSFLAALEIDNNPGKFFGPVSRQAPRAELVVEMPDYMRVDVLERAFGVSRSTLQAYNPALLPPVWDGAKYVPRGFRLRLPATAVIEAAPREALASIPASARFSAQVPDEVHVVRRGDTLSHVARRYGTSIAKLAQANGIGPGGRIRIGQKLKLPLAPGAAGRAVAKAAPAAPQPTVPAPAPGEVYTVQSGDSLSGIARKTGVSQRSLLSLNGLGNADRLRVGQKLRLGAPAAAAIAAEPVVTGKTPPPASLSDASNYSVAGDDSVQVQAAETLSHYAGWLQVDAEQLREANGWPRQQSLILGQKVTLVFTRVSRETFVQRRVAFHRALQESFFNRYRIADTTEHRLKAGESVWVLAAQKYKVPVWLLQQYNPELDLDQVRPGTRIVFPRLVRVAAGVEADGVVHSGKA